MNLKLLKIFSVISLINASIAINLDRLPPSSVPRHYDLNLDVDLETFTFRGSVTISIEVLTDTGSIALNSKNLNIAEPVTVRDRNGGRYTSTGILKDKYEMIEIEFDGILFAGAGEYNLTINFDGSMNDDRKGLYRSEYSRDDEMRSIGVTYFAPNFARELFPCYDEPQYKATFAVQVSHDKKYQALSNSPIEEIITFPIIPNTAITKFRVTPVRMSTYLLAIVISDYTRISNSGESFNIYAKEGAENDAELALEFGPESLHQLEIYLEMQYPMSKMDFIAIEDLLSGAMENWGLITYRSSRLLYDDEYGNTESYQNIHKIITHELAHQWFGNIITCSWWSHTWLNEGFATFFESYITSILKPDWRLMDQFVVYAVQNSLSMDSSVDTRAMTSPVTNTDELSVIYTFIAYQKAGSVIRMMHHAVSPETFQEIMIQYDGDQYLKAATPESLYSIFENKSPKSGEYFASWSDNPGYPVVHVERNYATGEISLTQERFTTDGPVAHASKFFVPINYATSRDPNFSSTTPKMWMDPKESSTSIIGAISDDWVVFNIQQTGYYRVNYDERNWYSIIKQLKLDHTKIHPVNRAQLIDDSFNLAKYNFISFNITLDLLGYLRNETDLIPILSALPVLDFIDKILDGSESYEQFEEFRDFLIRPIFKGIIEQENMIHTDKLLRLNIAKYACKFGLAECTTYAKKKFSSRVTDLDVRRAIYCGAAHAGTLQLMMERWVSITRTVDLRQKNLEEVNELYDAIGCYQDPGLYKMWLDLSYEKSSNVSVEDRRRVFTSVIQGGYVGTMTALQYMAVSYRELRETYGPFQTLWITLANQITSIDQQLYFAKVIADNEIDPEERPSIAAAQKLMAENVEWREANEMGIFAWISENEFIEEEDDSGDSTTVRPFFSLIVTIAICSILAR